MSINKENISEVTDIGQSDLQDLIDKYASKNMPVVDVVHAYIEHCVHLVFLMSHSPEDALDALEEHISNYYPDKDSESKSNELLH
jgi:hypothetical protein